jgi:hypothetical protein
MIRSAVDRLVSELGQLSAEQEVHAAAARRLADLLDGGEAPAYALPAVARELRAALGALLGAPVISQGVDVGELDELLRGVR